MRLLILTPEFETRGGGIATFYRHLTQALSDIGAELRVVEGSAFHAAASANRRGYAGAVVETLERSRLEAWLPRFAQFAATPSLQRHLAAAWALWEQAGFGADADIVEACDWGLSFIPPLLEANRPLHIQCHGSIGQIAQFDPVAGEETAGVIAQLMESALLAKASATQTYSHANAAFWETETGRRADVIRPAWAPTAPNVATDKPVDRGLVIGRLQCWKGPQILCEALAMMGANAPTIDWFGRDMPWGSRSRSTASELAERFASVWQTKLHHHAPVYGDAVTARQSSALFHVVPSTWDVFNFTAVEAMASGRPVIVSEGAGASELIEEGVTGFLFPAGDASALAERIAEVMALSPSAQREIGQAAQETVRTTLDPKRIAQMRIAAFENSIGNFAGARPAHVLGSIGAICRPKSSSASDSAFLEHFPLRLIASHAARRVGRKLGLN